MDYQQLSGFYAFVALIGIMAVFSCVWILFYWQIRFVWWRSDNKTDVGHDEKAFLAGRTYAVVPPKTIDGGGGAYFYPTVALPDMARTTLEMV